MSKKRKTRKQKEKAVLRPATVAVEETQKSQLYSIPKSEKTSQVKAKPDTKLSQHEFSYLRRDLISIASASGIIVAFNVLLAVLLFTSTVKLNFLGY